jgi:hypothetical protein
VERKDRFHRPPGRGEGRGKARTEKKKVGPRTRQEHPAMGVRVRGKATARPKESQRPHLKCGMCRAVGPPDDDEEMHKPCQSFRQLRNRPSALR